MSWRVVLHPAFDAEFEELQPDVREELLAQAGVLEALGPTLGRPRVDVTLRISGFFRDAFPAQIALFDSAVRAVADPDRFATRAMAFATGEAGET